MKGEGHLQVQSPNTGQPQTAQSCLPATSFTHFTGIILGMGSANKRRRYNLTPSLIGWAHTQNNPCFTI